MRMLAAVLLRCRCIYRTFMAAAQQECLLYLSLSFSLSLLYSIPRRAIHDRPVIINKATRPGSLYRLARHRVVPARADDDGVGGRKFFDFVS